METARLTKISNHQEETKLYLSVDEITNSNN